MALGQVIKILTCVSGSGPSGACPSGFIQQIQEAYVIDSSSESVINSLSQTFDPTIAGGFFALSFTMILICYFTAKSAGTIINFIKRR